MVSAGSVGCSKPPGAPETGADRPSDLEIKRSGYPGTKPDRAASQTAGNGHVAPEVTHPVLVWDLPTRVFHWTLVVCSSRLATGDPDRFRDLHVYFGYVVLGLICFRIFWGLAGSRYARFKAFLYGPRAAITYLADVLAARADRHVGHNPAGAPGSTQRRRSPCPRSRLYC